MQLRIGKLFAVFVILLAAAGARTFYLGAFQAGKLREVADGQQLTEVAVPALRGAILDRNGVPLAISEPGDDISATPYLVRNPTSAASRIASILRIPASTVEADLTKRNTGFVYVERRVPDATAQQVAALRIPGIALTPVAIRDYPDNDLAAQVLGTVGVDGNGLAGLEFSENSTLSGTSGVRREINDALGDPISVDEVKAARPGKPIRLTLDSSLENAVENVLAKVGSTYSPQSATAIVMNPQTGAILAMANWPGVNANNVGAAPASALDNRAVQMNFEPGSTFKVVAIGGALQDGLVTPTTNFYLPTSLQIYDRTIHDDETRPAEEATTSEILAQSSNIGAVEIGGKLGPTRFNYWVNRLGFGSLTGVDLPGEEQGIVPKPSQYSGVSMGNLPIGQGESVTPMQLTTLYAAIANGGILRPPHIVGAVDGKPTPEPVGHRVFDPSVASELRSMLQGVLAPGGTASQVSIPGYELAGKTGTANEVVAGSDQYSTSAYDASFVGFAPARDPKVVVSVEVSDPQGAIDGGQVAAPAFGQIMSFALPYLEIPPG
ncbi:MAG TPA: penicillin-binding protein 2 [Solirubrobacteraceae bacterium]|nr:penicillin-binding protein 2 [Solirubrobacteraceae bacterium]